jgi:hypothetical protein
MREKLTKAWNELAPWMVIALGVLSCYGWWMLWE